MWDLADLRYLFAAPGLGEGFEDCQTLNPRHGSAVVPLCPFDLRVSLLKPNIREKGTLFFSGVTGEPRRP